jgi:hypothetical protein
MYVRRDGRDVRSVEIMDMISIVMVKNPREAMRANSEGVSKGYAMYVNVGSTPVRSSM